LKKRQKEIFDSQTGSAQPHIYPQHIEILPVCELNKKDISEFNDIVSPLFNKIDENKQENKSLSALRDVLLPELMKGRIDISKVKEV
ncbi:MAG: restriction endonuclease subunit S, partial [Ruminococcus sp.]|nr:restriction endonuclease subunit S [Ruminococcus sp.]